MSDHPEVRRPIIIKKRHAAHEDEHNGQWKVAYADFMTALMAFFLIMWLLAITPQAERVIIAEYFSSSSIFDLPAGSGVMTGGKSVLEGGAAKSPEVLAAPATPLPPPKTVAPSEKQPESAAKIKDRADRQRLEALKAEVERIAQQGASQGVANHLLLEMTPEGLRINIFDRDGEAMFALGSFEPSARLSLILGVVAQVLGTVPNAVVVTGHTDAQPAQRGAYSNWELSADRANAVRRKMETDGLTDDRLISVEGRAATELLVPQAPLDARNRRISITLLRSEVEAQWRTARHDDAIKPGQ